MPNEPWVDWALAGMALTEARGLRKRQAAEGQKAGGKNTRDKTKPESSDDDADDPSLNEAAEEDSRSVKRRSDTGWYDDKQQAVQPPAGSSEVKGR